MKKILLTLTLAFIFIGANAQCTPDPQYTLAGIYPDSSVGMPAALVGQSYSEVITIITPVDTAIVFSGNRMPVILFLFGLFLIFFFKNKIKKTILLSFLFLSIIFSFVSSLDRDVEMQFLRFHGSGKLVLTKLWKDIITGSMKFSEKLSNVRIRIKSKIILKVQ